MLSSDWKQGKTAWTHSTYKTLCWLQEGILAGQIMLSVHLRVVFLGSCAHVVSLRVSSFSVIAEYSEITTFLLKLPFRIYHVPIFCDLNYESLWENKEPSLSLPLTDTKHNIKIQSSYRREFYTALVFHIRHCIYQEFLSLKIVL